MIINKTLIADSITSDLFSNNSLVDMIDYRISENEVINSDYSSISDTGTNVLSNLILNGTLTSDPIDYGGTSYNTSHLTFSNNTIATGIAGYEPSFQSNLLAVVLTFFCFATVFGNILVMVAVIKEPYLHTVTNYFIASLATADFIVGTVVMPFCVVLEVTNGYWPFGPDWCDVWRSIDVLASTASILNLCVISLDRYWAITNSMSYPSRMSPFRAAILIALVWICSALISFPAIAWWRAVADGPPPEYQCLFTDDLGYLVFSSIVSFYAPLIVMLVTYCRIYRAAMLQKRSLKLGTKQVHANGEKCPSLTLRIHRGGMLSPKLETNMTNGNHRGNNVNEGTTLRVPSRQVKSFSLSRKISKLAKERKAAKTLGIVMGVFILCWLPFFVTNVLMGFCGEHCVMNSKLVLSIVTWLGWTNSGMNPVIYALWSRDFRRAFTKLLCSCCPRHMRLRQTHRSRFRQVVRDDFTYPHLKSTHHPPTIEDIHL